MSTARARATPTSEFKMEVSAFAEIVVLATSPWFPNQLWFMHHATCCVQETAAQNAEVTGG